MEIMELEDHPYYVAVQYHPEYLSRPMDPSPPFLGLLLAAKDRLKSYFVRGCKLSPREPQSDFYDSGMCYSMDIIKKLSSHFLFLEEDLNNLTVKQLSVTNDQDDSSSAYSSSSIP